MKSRSEIDRARALQANAYVHKFLVESGEYQRSPHFRPENRANVRAILEELRAALGTGTARMIDFGCGTGFMIDLAADLFDEIHGVDISPDMMQRVDRSRGNIFLHESPAEKTPFRDGEFDLATAYSFMDHLYDYADFLREACRVLRPGGMFYADLNPNRDFIVAMQAAEAGDLAALPPIVRREVEGALHNGEYYQQSFGLDGGLLEAAEPIKSFDAGFSAAEVAATARAIGFSECRIEHAWFLGQGRILHEESPTAAARIDAWLQSVLPVSSALFKYLRFRFVK
jgi:ubiquinone/menaquinone biosynthesis C-methylase UbiE